MWLYRTIQYYSRKFGSYHIATYAASASFFIITAVFPLLMLVLSIISFTPWSTQDFIDMITLLLPESFAPLLNNLAAELVTSSITALSVSAVAVLWTAGKCMLGLVDGLNAIADVNDTRNFVFKRIICIIYMLVLILAVLVNLGLRVFGEHILTMLEDTFPYLNGIVSTVRQRNGLMLFLIMTLVFMLIYAVFPSRKMRILAQAPGAAFTSMAWMGFSALFSIYVNHAGMFYTLYGGLTTMILAMLWLYFCMYIVFIGAVINKIFPEIFWKGFVVFRRWRNRRHLAREERRARRLRQQQEKAGLTVESPGDQETLPPEPHECPPDIETPREPEEIVEILEPVIIENPER